MNVVRAVVALVLIAAPIAACSSFSSTEPDAPDGGVATEAGGVATEAGGDEVPPLDRATVYARAVEADHPVGYWRLHDIANAAVVSSEVSPETMAGVFGTARPQRGVPGIFDAAGGAYHFDGSKGMLFQVANVPFFGDTGVTVEAWFRPTAASDGSFRHVFEHSTAGDGSAYGVWLSGGTLAAEHYAAGQNQQAQLPEPTRNVWHYIAMTIAPGATGAITLYLDDADPQLLSKTKTQTPTVTELFTVGCKTPGDNAINGDLTEVAVYDQALAPDRIKAHHDLGKPASP